MTPRTQRKPGLYSRILKRLVREYRQFSNTPIKYHYKEYFIELPANHGLPENQRVHPKYDRFLPHLAKYVGRSDTIIDIGANVGDTLAAMAEQNPSASYICIEADDAFYRYLGANVQRITGAVEGLKVQTIKALVGKSISNVSLEGKGGTRHAVLNGAGSIKSMTLDAMISNAATNIRILKSDVDGFDYDVLDSSMSVIERCGPILFFECEYEHEYQRDGYAKTLKSLEAAGYCDWTLFDNFGEVVIRTHDLDVVAQLMGYIWRQNNGLATRTIYAYDVLAVQQKDSALVDEVLEEY